MKNINYLKILTLGILFISCEKDPEIIYETITVTETVTEVVEVTSTPETESIGGGGIYFIDDSQTWTSDRIWIMNGKIVVRSGGELTIEAGTIVKAEEVNTHGGSIRIYIKKGKKNKIDKSVKTLLKKEEIFGIKKLKTYKEFGEKINKLKVNVVKNINKLKDKNKEIIGFGAPAKATTALNFFGISDQINFIIEDNQLKHNKFVPGVKIPIKNKKNVKDKNALILVLAWNFYKDIKKNNSDLSSNFVNIKDLES